LITGGAGGKSESDGATEIEVGEVKRFRSGVEFEGGSGTAGGEVGVSPAPRGSAGGGGIVGRLALGGGAEG
jgi:hypothetical protein